MLTIPEAITLAVVTLIAAYVGVSIFANWAKRVKLLDLVTPRSSHREPTPRGAGLVIVVLTLVGTCSTVIALGATQLPLVTFMIGGGAIAAISWYDDVHGVPAGVRLAVHSFSAVMAMWGFGYWSVIALPVAGGVHLGWAGAVLTFLWIVGLTNAVNFMDGIDGITGTQAVIASSGWLVIGWHLHEPVVVIVSLLIAASSLGFLLHNWPPARVFMGDVGSAFLGYTLAVLPFFISSAPRWSALTALLFVWPVVFDSGATFLARLYRGENVFAAHRAHFYQRLVSAGREHRSVTALYAVLALAGALLALAWARQLPAAAAVISLALPVMSLAVWCVVRWYEHAPRRAQTTA